MFFLFQFINNLNKIKDNLLSASVQCAIGAEKFE